MTKEKSKERIEIEEALAVIKKIQKGNVTKEIVDIIKEKITENNDSSHEKVADSYKKQEDSVQTT